MTMTLVIGALSGVRVKFRIDARAPARESTPANAVAELVNAVLENDFALPLKTTFEIAPEDVFTSYDSV